MFLNQIKTKYVTSNPQKVFKDHFKLSLIRGLKEEDDLARPATGWIFLFEEQLDVL